MTADQAKALKFWGGLAGAIAAAGFSVGMLLGNYAKAADLEKVADALHDHAVNEAGKVGALEAQGRNIESDYHSVREQLWKIADQVGAQRVAEPLHVVPPLVLPSTRK